MGLLLSNAYPRLIWSQRPLVGALLSCSSSRARVRGLRFLWGWDQQGVRMWRDTVAGTHQRWQEAGGEAAGGRCARQAEGAPTGLRGCLGLGQGAHAGCALGDGEEERVGPQKRQDGRGCREPPARAGSCPVQGAQLLGQAETGGWGHRRWGAACPMIFKTSMGRRQVSRGPALVERPVTGLWTGVCRRHLGRRLRRGSASFKSKAS